MKSLDDALAECYPILQKTGCSYIVMGFGHDQGGARFDICHNDQAEYNADPDWIGLEAAALAELDSMKFIIKEYFAESRLSFEESCEKSEADGMVLESDINGIRKYVRPEVSNEV